MPRKRRSAIKVRAASYPITAEEVDTMFRVAAKLPPWPDSGTCARVAKILTGLTAQWLEERRQQDVDRGWVKPQPSLPPDADQYYTKWQHAALILSETRQNAAYFRVSPSRVAEAADLLERAIADACLVLAVPTPSPPNGMKRTAYKLDAFDIITVAQKALRKSGRSNPGVTRNSIAAHFTELALHRIGWRDADGKMIGREAIAKAIQPWLRE